MLQRSADSSPHTRPLIADTRDLPAARRRRTRRRSVVGIIVIAALVVVAGVAAVAGLASATAVPPAALAAPAQPTATPEASAAATGPLADTLSGQAVWLHRPAGDAVGVAYRMPGVDDDPQILVQDTMAAALLADGWAVASGDLTGTSWGSPASTQSMIELRGWVDGQLGDVPALYVGAGMGATTAVTSMTREPSVPVACVYAIAPVTDLATLVGAQPNVADQIAVAWQRLPATDENPALTTASLPVDTTYRVVIPTAPQVLVDDATSFVTVLTESGHAVTSITAPDNATPESFTDDLIAFAEGCHA